MGKGRYVAGQGEAYAQTGGGALHGDFHICHGLGGGKMEAGGIQKPGYVGVNTLGSIRQQKG